MLLFSFVGLSLLRFDADKLLELLFQLPPRTPRKDELIPPGCPFASARPTCGLALPGEDPHFGRGR